jgi:tetratricopeptide (TPR) repeat protein
VSRLFVTTVAASCVIGGAFLHGSAAHAQAATGKSAVNTAACTASDARPSDFRKRNQTSWLRWNYEDNWGAHTSPALDRLSKGELTRRVIYDLDWTLMRWPNHVPAMQGMVQYYLGGGLSYTFDPPECYFMRARRFAPDDISVLMQEAYFYSRKKDRSGAIAVYQEALKLDPNSTDVHYNMGLVYLDMNEPQKAVEHARLAYGNGYPLPGLKRRLERVGLWQQVVPAAANP